MSLLSHKSIQLFRGKYRIANPNIYKACEGGEKDGAIAGAYLIKKKSTCPTLERKTKAEKGDLAVFTSYYVFYSYNPPEYFLYCFILYC